MMATTATTTVERGETLRNLLVGQIEWLESGGVVEGVSTDECLSRTKQQLAGLEQYLSQIQ